ncbi:MAG TPA: CRISPR-associated helicase Cas3', partial [Leptospiraceae bacterium]|nr:CRISPR-associated helicase Cas3' [Leptospiraceae bacterium]
KRVAKFLEEMKHPIVLDLQLLHGAAFLNDNFLKLKIKAIYSNLKKPNVVAEEWFTHKKRSLLSDYGVGTVDQALLSVMNTKHQFVRIWGLGNRVIILDEVHAYDMYTSTLIESLIEWLFALGSSVILMSATLPKRKKDSLLKAFGATNNNYAEYPRITYLEKGETESHSVGIPKNPERKIEIQLKSTSIEINELAEQLLNFVSNGGCAVCIVNTVQRAQDIYKILNENNSDIELYLFHARFPAEDRKALEDSILERFGKDFPEKRPKKAILIATQVVEQSLDLDFDVMVTDLAPIDLILQRAGRLHRHKREYRFSHSIPTLYISGLGLEINSLNFGKPLYWKVVYEEYILLKTWWTLHDKANIVLPDEIDNLVESAYEENTFINFPDSFASLLRTSKNEMEEIEKQDKQNAVYSVIGSPLNEEWKRPNQIKQEDEDDLATHPVFIAKTRKGDRNVTVIPIFENEGKLYIKKDFKTEIDFNSELTFDLGKKLFLRSVNLSRKDVVNYLTSVPIPKNWKDNSLLRNCRPLVLKENQFIIGKLSVSYDEKLGIIYTNNE